MYCFQWLEQSLKNITEEPSNMKYAYVKQEDITQAFEDQTVIAIKRPKIVQMEFPIVEKVSAQKFDGYLKKCCVQLFFSAYC